MSTMGKKSKSKKIIRELLKEKIENENKKILGKKSKKEIKEEILKKKNNKKEEKPKEKKEYFKKARTKIKEKLSVVKKVNKKRLFGGVLAIIMLAILVSVGVLIFKKAFRPTPIAKYLPADKTVMVLELNTNTQHNQFIKTFGLLKNYPEYSFDSLVKNLEKTYSFDYQKQIKPWIGRQAGMAYLLPQKDSLDVNKIYFAEILSLKNLEILLSETSKKNYQNRPIYKFKNAGYISTIDDYIFYSDKEETIKQVLDSQNGDIEKLYNADEYRRIDDNLPMIRMGFLYLTLDKLNDGFFKETPFLSEKGFSLSAVYPFLKLFKAEGFVLVALDQNFAIESFLTLNTKKVEGGNYITFKQKYNAGLTDYISENTLAFWGGQNLEYQTKRIEEIFSGGDKGMMAIFDDLLQNYAQRYLGENVNLKEDILPLFNKEFALTIEQIGGENVYKLLVELENPRADNLKIQELVNNFAKMGGFIKPKIVEHKLPDGTVTREIVVDTAEIENNEEIYKNITIYGFKMGEKNWGIYFTFANNIAAISNSIDGVKNVIDLITGDSKNLRSTELYSLNIKPVLRNCDEIAYFNFEKLLPVLFETKVILEYLKPIESLSSGKNYFNDGVKTINYLHIK